MAETAASVLVVDDEPIVRDLLSRYLAHEGYAVHVAADGYEALQSYETHRPDVMVLDLMMPRLDGSQLLRLVRLQDDVPVIILSAKSTVADRVAGLDIGADDYIVKPYSPTEVLSRVRAVLRRSKTASPSVLRFGDLTIDQEGRSVHRAGESVHTTRKEFELLLLLATHPGQVFTREHLLERIWGHVWTGDTATVTVHMRRLRAKVEASPSQPRHILTVWGVGYRFVP